MSKKYNDPHFNWLQEQPRDVWINIKEIPDCIFNAVWGYFKKHTKQFWFSEEDQTFMIIESHLLNFEKIK